MATDDHGTLRDHAGQPKVYRAIRTDTEPSVSLAEAMIWPEDMTDWEAIRHAAELEFGRATPGSRVSGPLASRTWRYPALRGHIPLAACHEDHTGARCPACGAAT